MRVPIRSQLMGPLLVVAVASLCLVAVVYARVATTETRLRMERQAQGVAEVLSQSSFPLTDTVLTQIAGLAGAQFLLTDAEGGRVASSGPRADAVLHAVERSPTATSPADVDLSRSLRTPAEVFFYSSLNVDRPRAPGEPRTLHILVSKSDYDAAWRDAFLPPLLVGVLAAGGIAAVTHLATGRISRLMSRIGGEVNRLADGDFEPLSVPRLDDESRDLTLAVNRAAERLADYEQQVRKTERLRTLATLGAGMAHEVRNAATGCRMAIDLHEEECAASTFAKESLDTARRQLRIIEERLKQFLGFGKGGSSDETETLDFAETVRDALELTAAATRHAGVDLHSELPSQPCWVRGNPEGLTHSVVNLLLNATEAATKRCALQGTPSKVTVELSRGDAGVELIVADSGSGPDSSVAQQLFEPFVSEKPEGVGLGLAVVRAAAESSGGSVGWKRVDDQTQFVMRIPSEVPESVHG